MEYAAEMSPSATDAEVLERAGTQQRLLLTVDKDFGDLSFRLFRPTSGVVLLRIDAGQSDEEWTHLASAIQQLGPRLFGRYTVVGKGRIRSRPLPMS